MHTVTPAPAVTPAQAGVHVLGVMGHLDARLRGHDGMGEHDEKRWGRIL